MALDSSPATLTIEVYISGAWTNVSTSYTVRPSVKRDEDYSGGKGRFMCQLVQRGGGLDIRERQKVRVRNPESGNYIFRGYILDFVGDQAANEKVWNLTCEDASVDLDTHHLPAGYIVAAGTSDQDAIQDAFALYCPGINASGVNEIIVALAEIDASYMTMRQFLEEIQKQANSSQQPTYLVFALTSTGEPHLGWIDWNNDTHTPILSAELWETTTPDSTHVQYEKFELHRLGGRALTGQVVWGVNGSEGTIDGSVDATAPHVFTAVAATDVITTSTAHGLSVGDLVYVESGGTLPAGLAVDTEYYIATTPTGTTLTLARAASTALEVYAEPTYDRLWHSSHGFAVGWEVKFATTGTLPAPLVAGTRYYVVEKTTNSFKVGATAGGAVIDITTEGSGTHTVQPATLDITSTGSGTHTLYDVRFDQTANDAYDYYGEEIWGEPYHSETATTNHECRMEARARIHALGGARVTGTLETRTNIDPSDLGGPRKVRLHNTLWGLSTADPAWPIVRSSLDYSDGTAVWKLELGDRFIEFGDSDLAGQIGGQRWAGDRNAPAAPTWPSGTSWLLENEPNVDVIGDSVRIRILWNANTEGDMWRYMVTVVDTFNNRAYYPPAVYHSDTDIDLSYLGLPQGIVVQVSVRAQDTSGNISAPSLPKNIPTATYALTQTPNSSFEQGSPYDLTMAKNWGRVTTGSGTVVRDSSTAADGAWCMKLDTRAISSTAFVRSVYQGVQSTGLYTLFLAAKSHTGSMSGALDGRVEWYYWDPAGGGGAGAYVLISTSTPTNLTARNITASWVVYSAPITDKPSNATAARVKVGSALAAAPTWIYIDVGYLVRQLGSDSIEDGAITTVKIADDALTNAKIDTITDPLKLPIDIGVDPLTFKDGAAGVGRVSYDSTGSGTFQLQAIGSGEKLLTETLLTEHTLGGAASDIAIEINAASGLTGKLLSLKVNGVEKFAVDKDGNVTGEGVVTDILAVQVFS